MKNILLFIIDAMSNAYSNLDKEYSPSPFLDRLKKDGIYCDNVFSQGPYTEAALTPFYTGTDNLNYGGNFFRGDECSKTTFQSLRDSGYDVLAYTQPLIFPSAMSKGINEERYGVCFFMSAVWDYRLAYYNSLYKKGELGDKDFRNLYKLMDSNFAFAIKFWRNYKEKDNTFDFINQYCKKYDYNKNLSLFIEQYEKYKKNRMTYILELFKQGEDSPIFKVENIQMLEKAKNEDLYILIKQKYKNLFQKIKKFNKESICNNEHNLINTVLLLLKNRFNKHESYNLLKKYYYFKRLISSKREIKKMFCEKSNYKPEPSFSRYFEHFEKWLEKRNNEKPFFCMMHVSDLHTPEIFFSIDEMSADKVCQELDVLNDYIDKVPKDFKGNIIYLLSMRYVDLCLEHAINRFKESPYFENTTIFITADHGSSFRFYPLRESIVNNLYIENYNVPLIIYNNKDVLGFKNENYYTTKDIMKTIVQLADANDETFDGRNIIHNEKSTYSISEYLGGGCPDIFRKNILLAYRDEEYTIFTSQNISENSIDIKAVFNRKNDFFEERNIFKTMDKKLITNQVKILNNRFKSIKQKL